MSFLKKLYCFFLNSNKSRLMKTFVRNVSSGSGTDELMGHNVPTCGALQSGVILGFHQLPGGGDPKLTKSAYSFEEKLGPGRLFRALQISAPFPEEGEVRVFHGMHSLYSPIVIVGVGHDCIGYNEAEQMDEKKELIRTAAGAAVKEFTHLGVNKLLIESFGHAESAAEGASLGSWMYQEFKDVKKRRPLPRLELLDSCDTTGWQIGLHKAAAQNLARHLQEAPANHLTPYNFAQSAIELLSKYDINIEVRMKHWAKLRNLNAFLAVGKGACNPIFLEMFYEGCEPDICPVVLVGKGVTFNGGGLCIKTCKDMRHMRGDMAGAACVVATLRAVAALQLPINVRALIPLCTNLPAARSFKPGDTIKAHNGKTILVEDTNCEGLLMLADTLSYAREYNPKFILDVGTMACDTFGAIGQAATAVYSNNESLFEMMRVAAMHTGDRIWRFPLWNYFRDYMTPKTSDVTNNVPWMTGGGPCKTAAFLREFLPPKVDWIHADIQSVFRTTGEDFTYLRSGMSGRPTRTLVEFLAQLACTYNK